MTSVSVNTYTHSVTYVADNILKSIKDIIKLSGLNPQKFAENWDVTHRGLSAWLASKHLKRVVLEIYDPRTGGLIIRWDLDINYNYGTGDGQFWTDTDQLRYAIRKAGVVPSEAMYNLLVTRHDGFPAVEGWSDTSFRSTDGFARQSLGSTIDHNGLGASTAYWRKVG